MTVKQHTASYRRKTFSAGRRAKAQCPICGLVGLYTDLVRDWRGVKVCPDCLDPKDPQETPVVAIDPEALREPAPLLDTEGTEAVTQLEDTAGYWTTFS